MYIFFTIKMASKQNKVGKIDPELEEYKLAMTTFKTGKHKGMTYEKVRQEHSEYFGYLFSQPVYQVYKYFDFISYCLDHLQTECIWDEDFLLETVLK